MKVKIKTYPSDEDNKKMMKEIEELKQQIDKNCFISPNILRSITFPFEDNKDE